MNNEECKFLFDYSLQNNKMLMLHTKGVDEQIPVHSITHIICDSYYIQVFDTEGDTHDYCGTLQDLHNELVDLGFVRINRQIVLNMQYVKNCRCEQQQLELFNHEIFTASRAGWHRVKQFCHKK